MSIIAVNVLDARAVLDEEEGEFTIQVRLANGQEVRYSSHPGPAVLAELKAAMLEPEPEPVKPRRRTKKVAE